VTMPYTFSDSPRSLTTGTAISTYVTVVRWYSLYAYCQLEGPNDYSIWGL